MSYKFGPKIVTDGLILYMDASNPSSYVNGSNLIYGLGTPNIFGSLSSVSYLTDYSGNLSFNGSSSVITTNDTSSISNNFTIDVWCRPTNTIAVYSQTTSGISPILLSGHRFIVAADNRATNSGAGISVGTNGINVIEHGNFFFPAPLVHYTTISSTVFTNITLVYISKQPNLYINGVFIKTGLITASPTTFMSTGSQGIGSLYGFYQGSISNIKWYNKSLSATEILQNYNAIKSRFEL